MSEVKIWLPGRAPGKARPRLGKHGVYMPPAYVEWKNVAIANIVK